MTWTETARLARTHRARKDPVLRLTSVTNTHTHARARASRSRQRHHEDPKSCASPVFGAQASVRNIYSTQNSLHTATLSHPRFVDAFDKRLYRETHRFPRAALVCGRCAWARAWRRGRYVRGLCDGRAADRFRGGGRRAAPMSTRRMQFALRCMHVSMLACMHPSHAARRSGSCVREDEGRSSSSDVCSRANATHAAAPGHRAAQSIPHATRRNAHSAIDTHTHTHTHTHKHVSPPPPAFTHPYTRVHHRTRPCHHRRHASFSSHPPVVPFSHASISTKQAPTWHRREEQRPTKGPAMSTRRYVCFRSPRSAWSVAGAAKEPSCCHTTTPSSGVRRRGADINHGRCDGERVHVARRCTSRMCVSDMARWVECGGIRSMFIACAGGLAIHMCQPLAYTRHI